MSKRISAHDIMNAWNRRTGPAKQRVYRRDEIQTVYKRHHDNCGTVLYSTDEGYTWQSVPMDSGKWDISNWIFSFIELTKK